MGFIGLVVSGKNGSDYRVIGTDYKIVFKTTRMVGYRNGYLPLTRFILKLIQPFVEKFKKNWMFRTLSG
jgi:hypothetical protein